MDRPPRPRRRGSHQPRDAAARLAVPRRCSVAALSMGGFFFVLLTRRLASRATHRRRHPLHHAYLQATTMTFVGMIAGQIGTAFAVRTSRASLRAIGVFTNRTCCVASPSWSCSPPRSCTCPPLQSLLGTAALRPASCSCSRFPFIVWGADELRRWRARRRAPTPLRSPSPRPPAYREDAGRDPSADVPARDRAGGAGAAGDLSASAGVRRGARDAHLVGVPRRRAGLQAQEAARARLPRLRHARAPAGDVRGRGAAQPPPGARHLSRRPGRRARRRRG